jgi:hypothetical protein
MEKEIFDPSNWDHRVTCIDQKCIGIIGENGKCKTCGLEYNDALPFNISNEKYNDNTEVKSADISAIDTGSTEISKEGISPVGINLKDAQPYKYKCYKCGNMNYDVKTQINWHFILSMLVPPICALFFFFGSRFTKKVRVCTGCNFKEDQPHWVRGTAG